MAKETIKVLEIDTKPAETSIKDLRKQLKGFKDEMANLEEGSDAFLEVANKAGEVKHQLDEINESIKGASADFGDMIGNVTNVAAGITGAFQAVAGGLQAMGIESKAIDETIVRMQGLMAVTQGLSAIDEGVKSFDKLTKSLGKAGETLGAFVKGLGKIAAPVAIVTALGLAFAKLKERIDGTNAALKEREEAQRIFNSELEREIEIRKRAGFEEEELLQFEISKLEIRNQKLQETNIELPKKDFSQWIDFYLSLERLDDNWTNLLIDMKTSVFKNIDIPKKHMQALEKLLLYFIYRHVIDEDNEAVKFSIFSVYFISMILKYHISKYGELSLEDIIEYSRMYSSEIEYSDENVEILLQELQEYNDTQRI